ncbi:phage tail tape measure protein [Roseitranquillus sediminis]|uniref:phage tail tape measure protein n=1 Tax=Roseitranquillus sediminis TaxID=2809051 RepID=UPI001D0CBC01|nr:phage tail tape measure protein [Roseitranquillus sediminis]MBM9595205.1 phage tail tape measure protein [Roseitranquillus sediminis]
MREIDSMGSFEDQVAALEEAMAGARNVASGFSSELGRVQSTISTTNSGVKSLSVNLGRDLKRAFDDVIFDGRKLSEALSQIGRSMINTAFSAAVKPVTNQVSGLFSSGVQSLVAGMMPFAAGGSLTQGRVRGFASGGVVSSATSFSLRDGMGLMGEAGPEAIMPLARGSDGKLGVRGDSGRSVSVVFNISTPDIEGFRRSQSQIAAQMNRALGRGDRNS